jgi:hypothetical protein
MKNLPKQLPIPDAAQNDRRAFELLRVWVAEGNQHVSIATGVWKEPAYWGIMLVDLAKHIANAFEQTTDISYLKALQRLREGFDAEWDSPTGEPKGNIQD